MDAWAAEYARLATLTPYVWAQRVLVKKAIWQPGAEMAARVDAGESAAAVAAAMGFALKTVQENVKTRGVDHRCSGICDQKVGEYTLEQVLTFRPLPCGPRCVCSYVLACHIGS